MLSFFKRKRKEAALGEARRIADEAIARMHAAIDRWRAERLENRRDALALMFEERIPALEASEELSLQDMLEIEADALLHNWNEGKEVYYGEFSQYVSKEDLQIIEMVGGASKLIEMLDAEIEIEGGALAEELSRSMTQELSRRSAG